MTSVTIAEAIYAAGGNARVAADRLGVGRQAMYARVKRAGLDVVAIRRAAQECVPLASVLPGPAPVPVGITEAGVTLTVADYALLSAQAAEGRAFLQTWAELQAAERIIATLTARLEERLAA